MSALAFLQLLLVLFLLSLLVLVLAGRIPYDELLSGWVLGGLFYIICRHFIS